MRWPRRLVVAGLLTAGIAVGLHVSTRSYVVYSNDFPMVVQVPVFLAVFGCCLVVVAIGLRRVWTWLLLALLVAGIIICRSQMIRIRLQNCTASCANHSGVWWQYFDHDASQALPDSTDFYDFLSMLHGDRLHLGAARCPGYRRAGNRTGVVFVGGGLHLDSLRDHEVLIAFCSWQSHPPPYDHQHCLLWHWGQVNDRSQGMFDRECTDTADMTKRIQKALAQASAGDVPYSPDAVEILKHELAKRQELAKEMESTQPEN